MFGSVPTSRELASYILHHTSERKLFEYSNRLLGLSLTIMCFGFLLEPTFISSYDEFIFGQFGLVVLAIAASTHAIRQSVSIRYDIATYNVSKRRYPTGGLEGLFFGLFASSLLFSLLSGIYAPSITSKLIFVMSFHSFSLLISSVVIAISLGIIQNLLTVEGSRLIKEKTRGEYVITLDEAKYHTY